MSIRSVIVIVLICLATCQVAALFIVMEWKLVPTLAQIERRAADIHFQQLQRDLLWELEALRFEADAWVVHEGAADVGPSSDLSAATLDHIDVDWLAYLPMEKAGARIWLLSETQTRAELDQALQRNFVSGPLSKTAGKAPGLEGFLPVGDGVTSLLAVPVGRADAVDGLLLVGRFLDSAWLEATYFIAGAKLRLMDGSGGTLAETSGGELAEASTVGQRTVTISTLVPTLDGSDPLTLALSMPDTIRVTGVSALQAAVLAMGMAGPLLLALLGTVLRERVLDPVRRLTDHIREMRRSGDLGNSCPEVSGVEFSLLSRALSELGSRLSETLDKLRQHAYRAGAADHAAQLMHVTGNGVNRLSSLIGHVCETLSHRDFEKIPLVLKELGSSVPSELERVTSLAERWQSVHQRRIHALESLRSAADSLNQINSLLQQQIRAEEVKAELKPLALTKVVDAAVLSLPYRYRAWVSVSDEVATTRVQSDRRGLVDALTQILRNAGESIERRAEGQGEIRISAAYLEDDREVRLSIRDNGVGIEEGRLLEIFQHQEGDGTGQGRGLHWTANTLAAISASVEARSDGLGRGATFEIVLPAESSVHEVTDELLEPASA